MTGHSIALFGRDPGGTNQVIALHEVLRERAGRLLDSGSTSVDVYLQTLLPPDGMELLILGKDAGIRQWAMAGIQAIDVASMDDAALRSLLSEFHVLAVLTGTSDIDDRTDHRLWRISESMGIPSAAFLDHTTNLYSRFIGADGIPRFPDRIFTLNQESYDHLALKGAPQERLTVGGDLHLYRLKQMGRRTLAQEKSTNLRAIWGVQGDDRVILFASECVQEMAGLGRQSSYSEFAALDELIYRLQSGEKLSGLNIYDLKNVVIVIRPHPRDRKGKYQLYSSRGDLRITISSEGDATSAILASDLVVGMDSTLLKEALVLNVPTLSLLASNAIL